MPTTTQILVHSLLLFNNCNHKIKCLEFAPLIPVVNPYQSMFISTKLSCLDITYTCSDRKSKPSLKFGILHSMSCSVCLHLLMHRNLLKNFHALFNFAFFFFCKSCRDPMFFGLGRTAVLQKFSFVTREPLTYCSFFLLPEEIPWWHNKC